MSYNFDDFMKLESVQKLRGRDQCFAFNDMQVLLRDGIVILNSFTNYAAFLAICQELGLNISEYKKTWHVSNIAAGVSITLALTEAVRPWWACAQLLKPVIYNS